MAKCAPPPHGRSTWRPADQPTTRRSTWIACMVFFKKAPNLVNIPATTTTKTFPKVLRYEWESYCDTNGGRHMGGILRYKWEEYWSISLSWEPSGTESTAIQIGGVLRYKLEVYCNTFLRSSGGSGFWRSSENPCGSACCCLWAGLRVAMWITHVGGKFSDGVRVRFRVQFQAVKVPIFGGFPLESPTEKAKPPQSSSKGNFFVRVRFGEVSSTVEEVVRVRFCCLLSWKTKTGNTGRTVLGHRPKFRHGLPEKSLMLRCGGTRFRAASEPRSSFPCFLCKKQGKRPNSKAYHLNRSTLY